MAAQDPVQATAAMARAEVQAATRSGARRGEPTEMLDGPLDQVTVRTDLTAAQAPADPMAAPLATVAVAALGA
jgi:hypothetical protein